MARPKGHSTVSLPREFIQEIKAHVAYISANSDYTWTIKDYIMLTVKQKIEQDLKCAKYNSSSIREGP